MSGRLNGADGRGWAVVTGASSGIGSALARALAVRGYDVLLVARRHERLQDLATTLSARYGVATEIAPCDLADADEREALCDDLRMRCVAVLCNNAGFTTCGLLRDAEPARERAAVAVNVTAVHDLTLAVLPDMLARNEGAILITGSAAGEQPVPSAATYAATKAFANSFSQALSVELRGTRVTCTLLAPGPVRTEFFAIGGVDRMESLTRYFAWQTPERVARDAVRALERGRRVVIPGPVARVQAVLGRYTPRALLFPLLRLIFLPIVRYSRPAEERQPDRVEARTL